MNFSCVQRKLIFHKNVMKCRRQKIREKRKGDIVSDRMYARIEIPKKFLKDTEVRKAIQEEFWFEEDIENFAEDVTENTISFSNEDARNGQFCYLEDFLEEKKVPFDRMTSAYYPCGEIYLSYRPEYGTFISTGEDGRQIPCDIIRDLLEKHKGDYIGFKEELVKLLDEKYDPKLKELGEYV